MLESPVWALKKHVAHFVIDYWTHLKLSGGGCGLFWELSSCLYWRDATVLPGHMDTGYNCTSVDSWSTAGIWTRALRWYDHIDQMEEERLSENILYWSPQHGEDNGDLHIIGKHIFSPLWRTEVGRWRLEEQIAVETKDSKTHKGMSRIGIRTTKTMMMTRITITTII
jgi:hypothetical protein